MSGPAYFPFFPQDWLDGVRELTPEQTGAYINLLCGMYQGDGRIRDDSRLACRLIGCAPQKWPLLREQLIALGKLSIPEPGYLSNGRCIREIMRRKARIEAAHDGRVAGGKASARKRAAAARVPQEHAPEHAMEPAGVAATNTLENNEAAQLDSRLKTQNIGSPVSTPESESQTPNPTPPIAPSRKRDEAGVREPVSAAVRWGWDVEPPAAPPVPAKAKAKAAAKRVDAANPDGFEAWWREYPRKDDKGHARQAYATALRAGVTPEQLLDGLRRYAFDPRRKYRPLGATWLNGERWLNEDGAEPEFDSALAAAGLTPERAAAVMNSIMPDPAPPAQAPMMLPIAGGRAAA